MRLKGAVIVGSGIEGGAGHAGGLYRLAPAAPPVHGEGGSPADGAGGATALSGWRRGAVEDSCRSSASCSAVPPSGAYRAGHRGSSASRPRRGWPNWSTAPTVTSVRHAVVRPRLGRRVLLGFVTRETSVHRLKVGADRFGSEGSSWAGTRSERQVTGPLKYACAVYFQVCPRRPSR